MFTSLELTNDSYHSDLQSAYISPLYCRPLVTIVTILKKNKLYRVGVTEAVQTQNTKKSFDIIHKLN